MGQLTPFQNQVLDAASAKEQEEKEKAREEARQGNNGRQRNPRAGGSGGGSAGSGIEQKETVRYVNKNEYPDHEIHESD